MPIPVSVCAPSSATGSVELRLGLQRLRAGGFEPIVHAETLARHFLSAGTDEQRGRALIESVMDPRTQIIWCARGGYGAGRLMPMLQAIADQGVVPPRKLLVGYSDIAPLHEFVRERWGWSTLHAPMVTVTRTGPGEAEWHATCELIRRRRPSLGYESTRLRWWANAPAEPIEAELVGGNLSLWTTLAGTPWQPRGAGRILFLEDIAEKLYRIDRYVVQLDQAGMFRDCAAIVLGDFTNCDDESNQALLETDSNLIDWETHPRVPLRRTWGLEEGLKEIFIRVAGKYDVPLAAGLPVGHGPNYWPLPLGAKYRIGLDGSVALRSWDWAEPMS